MGNFQNACNKLEFEIIRQRIIRYASSQPGIDHLMKMGISNSLQLIQHELACVSQLKRLIELEDEVPLAGIYPVAESVQKAGIEGTVLQPKELLHIGSTLRAGRILKSFLSRNGETAQAIWEIAEPLYTDKILEFNIDRAIDEGGAVRATASKELQSIRRSITEKYDQLERRLVAVLKNVSDQGFTQDEIITTREGRMVIPVKAEHKNRVHGFIHSASASGATVFIEPSETLDLNNEIRNLQFQEQREVERILRDLTIQIGSVHEQIKSNLMILARLDALHAKAKYSIEIIGIEPTVVSSGAVKLASARHPILLQAHGRAGTIPLDIELGASYNTLIISGPNAGGKSVAMKTVGLLTLMAQAGLHIPAGEQSVIRCFEEIEVDIGDEQSIENDLSTFSSHLINLKRIDETADANTLVLIDEVGAGTDPAEGGAIAASLLESLTRRGTLTIATTHHSALKVFAHNTPGVENGAMEFDQETLTPTYKFRSGIPGSSYALEMAQRLGMQAAILSRSREFMGDKQVRLEQLIAELESSAQRYRNELETVTEERSHLQRLIADYEAKLSVQAKELKELKRKAVAEAEDIVKNANAVIERSIREIRERSAEKGAVKQARVEVEQIKKTIHEVRSELPLDDHVHEGQPLSVGNFASLHGGNEPGEIISISADGKSAVVVFGSLKMKVAVKDLVPSKRKAMPMRSSASIQQDKPTEVLRDIDLRGMTGEEAIPLVDKFLDTAMLAGLHRVDIIHGKGTGALRKRITDFLSGHPKVKSFRLGEWNEGGTGATVVELTES